MITRAILLAILLLLTGLTGTSESSGPLVIAGFSFTAEQLGRTPHWHPEEEDNPPLSASKALAAVLAWIGTLPPEKTKPWEFEELSLEEVRASDVPDGDHNHAWVWTARCQPKDEMRKRPFGNWPKRWCYVLMDGTLIDPQSAAEAGRK
jgi:hypothetical protein